MAEDGLLSPTLKHKFNIKQKIFLLFLSIPVWIINTEGSPWAFVFSLWGIILFIYIVYLNIRLNFDAGFPSRHSYWKPFAGSTNIILNNKFYSKNILSVKLYLLETLLLSYSCLSPYSFFFYYFIHKWIHSFSI